MNLLRRFRVVSEDPQSPTHAADRNSLPALASAFAPLAPVRVVPLPAPPRDLHDPPIFAEVMNDWEWDSLPTTVTLAHLDPNGEVLKLEHTQLTNPPIDIQFEVIFLLDELTDVDRAECAARAKGTAIVGLA